MRCIAIFVYMDENSHLRVRSEIVNYLLSNWRNYENITLHTGEGDKSIIDYINWIKIPGRWSGNNEFIAAYKLYNINILTKTEILDNNFKTLYYQYVYSFGDNIDMNKDLCIISNTYNTHYKLLYSKTHKVFKINNIIIFNYNNNNSINDFKICESSKKLSFTKSNKIDNDLSCNKKSLLDNNDNKSISMHDQYKIHIELIEFSNLKIEDILKLYNEGNKKKNKYSDIYKFILSKNKPVREWPDYINSIDEKKKEKQSKLFQKNMCKLLYR